MTSVTRLRDMIEQIYGDDIGCSLKVPDLSHLGPIWPNLDAKFDLLGIGRNF